MCCLSCAHLPIYAQRALRRGEEGVCSLLKLGEVVLQPLHGSPIPCLGTNIFVQKSIYLLICQKIFNHILHVEVLVVILQMFPLWVRPSGRDHTHFVVRVVKAQRWKVACPETQVACLLPLLTPPATSAPLPTCPPISCLILCSFSLASPLHLRTRKKLTSYSSEDPSQHSPASTCQAVRHSVTSTE